jgi:Zn-dependent protease with chaperone function
MPSATAALIALFVLLPGGLRLWWGRQLTRHLTDPALPERLLANQRRNQIVLFSCIVGLLMSAPYATIWTLPSLIVTRGIASFPLRRKLYGETWSVMAYLSFFGRLVVAIYGFFIVLLVTPDIAGWCGRFDWLAGIGLALVLVVWADRSPDVIRLMLRARPITDPALLPRFEQMARTACGANLPRFEYVELGGGAVANAVALPSVRASGVLFSSTSLTLLDRDEIIAICVHEIAHLEYYNPRRMRVFRVVNLVLIAIAAAVSPYFRMVDPSSTSIGQMVMVGLIFVVLIWRAKDRQKHETDSDLRAIALCGDAEALARGLEKLYAFAKLPRRWDAQHERRATHPSLARRIRDIRASAGIAPAPLTAPATFTAADGRTSVAFEENRIEWRENEGVTHGLAYSHLSELRVHAAPSGSARLIAVDRTGRRWEMALAAHDVPAVQIVLDTVDGRLALVTTPRLQPSVVRIAALLGFSLSASLGQLAFSCIALLTLARPESRLLTGAAVASLTSALLGLRDWGTEPHGTDAWMVVVMAAMAVGFLFLGQIMRRAETGPLSMKPLAMLGAASLLFAAPLTMGGFDAVQLHLNVRAAPSVVVLLLAFAAALAADRRRRVRVAAAAPALLGAALVGAGTLTFLDQVGRDPFLVTAGPPTIRTLDSEPAFEIPIAFSSRNLRLSPGARAIAISPDIDRDDDMQDRLDRTFRVGRADGPLAPIMADDLVFVDDDHVLTLDISSGAADIREIEVSSPQTVTWRERVEGVRSGRLSVTGDGNEWQLLGWTHGRHIVRALGRLGNPGAQTTEWTVPPNSYGWTAITASGTDALYVDTSYDSGPFEEPLLSALYSVGTRMSSRSRLWRLGASERAVAALSHLDLNCTSGGALHAQLVCSAFDGTRTRVVTIEPGSAHITPVSTLWGHFSQYSTATSGWLTGWLDSTPLALRLATNEVLQISARPGEWISSVAATDAGVGTVSSRGGDSVIRLYRLQPALRAARRSQ